MVQDEHHLSCKLCGLKVEKFEDMKQHIRDEHCKSKASQSEIKENKLFDYPCFYCDEMVSSEEQLRNHRKAAHESFLCDFLCSECGRKCNSKNDLDWHKKTKHGPFAPIQEIKRPTTTYPFRDETCDFCDEQCLTLAELQDHMRSKHPLPF